MTPEQQQAIDRARAAAKWLRVPVAESWVREHPDIAAEWLNELRRINDEIAAAFPEGGDE